GLRGMALVVPDSGGRSLYGVAPEAMLLRRYRGSGLGVYAVGGAGLALEGGDGDGVVALWNAGLGLELKAPSIVSAGIEVRRFAEDRG
ncbi:MAG: hypothetical protein GWN07_19310, partial [Actinobacteria bacterium]|nr:hypothetical protein [Actinomycetota bacterium]NIU65811.1 hypothetical protein [Actinomycetota bacterium]NIW29361.1 hypothetical protein [Actinomycetota bacterium]NIX21868.1 hypothetical protein [Actinomycetota bacterium]